MPNRVKQFLLLVLLVILPFQGVGAAIHSVTCAPEGHATASLAGVDAAHADHALMADGHANAHSHDGSGSAAGDHSQQHPCCHFIAAAATTMARTVKADPPVLQSEVALFGVSNIPEQPQRPPRT